MIKRETRITIVAKLIESVFCLLMLYSFLKLTMWLWPGGKWINIGFAAVLAIDYAAIISELKPKGILSKDSWLNGK